MGWAVTPGGGKAGREHREGQALPPWWSRIGREGLREASRAGHLENGFKRASWPESELKLPVKQPSPAWPWEPCGGGLSQSWGLFVQQAEAF